MSEIVSVFYTYTDINAFPPLHLSQTHTFTFAVLSPGGVDVVADFFLNIKHFFTTLFTESAHVFVFSPVHVSHVLRILVLSNFVFSTNIVHATCL